MFTGLIEEIGHISLVTSQSGGLLLKIAAKRIPEDLKPEDSVAVNGVCLTVVSCGPDGFEANVVPETMHRTSFSRCRKGDEVNLERALRLGDRLGGHWVQGHIDGVGRIISVTPAGTGKNLSVRIPMNLCNFLVEKGSVALHGVSLTVAEVKTDIFSVALIPVTLTHTTLGMLKPGESVNIEVDILAKYIQKQLKGGFGTRLTDSDLHAMGYET